MEIKDCYNTIDHLNDIIEELNGVIEKMMK